MAFESKSSLPINVLLPSSTEPAVANRKISICRGTPLVATSWLVTQLPAVTSGRCAGYADPRRARRSRDRPHPARRYEALGLLYVLGWFPAASLRAKPDRAARCPRAPAR